MTTNKKRARFEAYGNYLVHFGIPGQKWGVRRFQNEDGTLTEEGKQRYYGLTEATANVFNNAADRANAGLAKINKKYDKIDLNDDRNNLEYSREIRDMWKQVYREELAKDLGTDPASLKGQKWLDELYGYKSNMDLEVEDLEKKVKAQEKKNQNGKSVPAAVTKSVKAPAEKYANTKMSSSKAINTAYADLEKMYPNFSKMPLKKQDKLFFDYLNESGLYRWV